MLSSPGMQGAVQDGDAEERTPNMPANTERRFMIALISFDEFIKVMNLY